MPADRHFTASPSSAPCLLHELQSDGSVGADPEQARDLARWRRAERDRLMAARLAMSAGERSAHAQAIIAGLDALVTSTATTVVSVYWPIRGEPDLRPWMHALALRGAGVALPVALGLGRALEFREWHPGARMARGLWKIPYPAEGARVVPSVVIAPLVGFDAGCYRLGYGGGFFDRTLAAMAAAPPLAIGVGYTDAELPTIFPQPYDMAMRWIVTPAGTRGPAAARTPEGRLAAT